jgi:hypothetical protein
LDRQKGKLTAEMKASGVKVKERTEKKEKKKLGNVAFALPAKTKRKFSILI